MAAITFVIKNDDEINKYLKGDCSVDICNAPKNNLIGKINNIQDEDEESIKENSSDQFANTFKDEIREEDLITDKPGAEQRSRMNKLFGPLDPGSVRGSIFNMIILSLGSGCLSLPKYVGKISLLMSIVLVITIGLLVWWTLSLLSIACNKSKTYVYSRLVKDTYGKYLARFFDLIVILYVFGILILYQVIIYTLIGETIYSLYYYRLYATIKLFQTKSFWGLMSIKCAVVYGVGLFIILPLCLVKDVSKLRIASLFGIITLIGIIILLIVQLPSYISYYWDNVYKEADPNTHLNLFDFSQGFTKELDFFQYCSSVYYSYIVTTGAVPIFRTLQNNVIKRVQKVISRTVISDIFLYSIIIIIGYLTFPINTPSLIIERDKIVRNEDISMSIGRIALVLTIIMKLPSSYSSVRVCLFDLIWGVTEINSSLNNFLLTLFVLIFCCSVGVLYSEISSYIKLIGGICSGIVGFVMPALLYVKANEYSRWNWKNVVTIVICFGLTFIGFISAGKTIYDMIKGENH